MVGIDITPVEPIAGATVLPRISTTTTRPAVLARALGGPADVVLSDMAAPATGHAADRPSAHHGAGRGGARFRRQVLKPGGSFVAKVLRGGTERALLDRLKRDFAKVRHVKPEASRAEFGGDVRRREQASAASFVPGPGRRRDRLFPPPDNPLASAAA